MKTYDPLKGMVYRHMAREAGRYSVPVVSTNSINRLPIGYANGSPQTYVGRTRPTSSAAQGSRGRSGTRGRLEAATG